MDLSPGRLPTSVASGILLVPLCPYGFHLKAKILSGNFQYMSIKSCCSILFKLYQMAAEHKFIKKSRSCMYVFISAVHSERVSTVFTTHMRRCRFSDLRGKKLLSVFCNDLHTLKTNMFYLYIHSQ